MAYPEVIRYLNSFINYEKDTGYSYKTALGLARIGDFLSIIGNPQNSLRAIHIAGSKGKGSTSAFCAYILREAGFRVGLYTSPHLHDFRERIRILKPFISKNSRPIKDFEGMISPGELSRIVSELKPAINKYNRISKYGPLSFFEVYTAIAFLYFKQEKTDFVVLETGLGGRLDATNVVLPLICAITPISYEHTQKLGKTLSKIAAEKAGIIKKCGSTVISAPQEKEAQRVLRSKCRKTLSRLYELGKDITYRKIKDEFSVKGIFSEYPNLKIRLLGKHQLINASVAVGVIEALRPYNIVIGVDTLRRGLYNTIWPGRCEVIKKSPLIVLDGAQNLASVNVLKSAIKDNFKYRKLILVLGISQDKDIAGICGVLQPLADEIILTCAATPRASRPEKLAGYFKKKIYLTQSVKEACLLAQKFARAGDLILVTGSLFVVGEFRNVYG